MTIRFKLSTALAGAALLTLIVAGTVGAHTPSWSLDCEHGLRVNLASYNTSHDNSVSIDVDGVNVVDDSDFGASYSYDSGPLDPYASHTAHLVVWAWDDSDPYSSPNWSVDVSLSLEACAQSTTSESSSTESSSTESTSTESSTASSTESSSTASTTESSTTESSTASTSESSSTSFTGSQSGESSSTASHTLPNTATLDGPGAQPRDPGWVALSVLGLVLGSALLLLPYRSRNRR